jgi:hypothetical protein
MRRERLASWPIKFVHAIALLAGWALFFYWWYEVAIQDWNRTLVALIIFVTLIVAPVITVGWVAHNISLFRRKGPRLGAPKVSLDYPRDWNGRTIDADWDRMREARLVEVSVDGDRKVYTPGDPSAPGRS